MLRYALLGGGMMGREHIRNLALIDDAEVVAVAEPNQAMQLRCQTLVPDAKIVASLDELLKLNAFDALIVATPNYQHAGQLLEIFQKTSLPILVEKPLVTERDDIARIREAAALHGAPVWVAMEYRYMPPLQSFLEQLDRIGDLQTLSIREHRFPFLKKVDDWNRFNRNSGGTLVEKCCHFSVLEKTFF
jgi:predicted dehydrogenase